MMSRPFCTMSMPVVVLTGDGIAGDGKAFNKARLRSASGGPREGDAKTLPSPGAGGSALNASTKADSRLVGADFRPPNCGGTTEIQVDSRSMERPNRGA